MNKFLIVGDATPREFLIEDGIAIPLDSRFVRGPTNFLFDVLNVIEVGQSTTVPVNASGRPIVRIANATRDIVGKTFTQRTMTENGKKIVRVWRVS